MTKFSDHVLYVPLKAGGLPTFGPLVTRVAVPCCVLLCATACSIAAEAPAASEKPAPATVQQILQAWQARESNTVTAQFAWSADRDGANRWSAYQAANVPKSKALLAKPEYRLLLDQTRLRYTSKRWHRYEHLEYAGFSRLRAAEAFPVMAHFYSEMNTRFADASKQLIDSVPFTRLFDGQRRIDFFAASEERPPLAVMEAASTIAVSSDEFTEDLFYRPILLNYRPSAVAAPQLHPDSWRIAQQDSFVSGHRCVVLEEASDGNRQNVLRRYWVDPSRDCIIVRSMVEEKGAPREQLDIEYRHDSKHGWVPKVWQVMLLPSIDPQLQEFPGRNRIFQYAAAAVDSFAINVPVERAEFELAFPVGTVVFDDTTNDEYAVGEFGQRRALTKDDLAQLRVSPDLGERRRPFATFLTLAAVIASVAGITFVAARVIRRRTRQQNPTV